MGELARGCTLLHQCCQARRDTLVLGRGHTCRRFYLRLAQPIRAGISHLRDERYVDRAGRNTAFLHAVPARAELSGLMRAGGMVPMGGRATSAFGRRESHPIPQKTGSRRRPRKRHQIQDTHVSNTKRHAQSCQGKKDMRLAIETHWHRRLRTSVGPTPSCLPTCQACIHHMIRFLTNGFNPRFT